jgi:hypothetical protein
MRKARLLAEMKEKTGRRTEMKSMECDEDERKQTTETLVFIRLVLHILS